MKPPSFSALLALLSLLALLAPLSTQPACTTGSRDDFRDPTPATGAPTAPSGRAGGAPDGRPFEAASAPRDWNRGEIAWRELDEGLREARASNKPIMLVVHAEWCSHCRNYSRIFHDPALTSLSERFVMVLADSDQTPSVNQRYAADGGYVPRTYFLDSNGRHRPEIDADRARFRYFFDENRSGPTIAAMNRALR